MWDSFSESSLDWGRLTERAREALFFANEAARRRGETDVSTEHLLFGIVSNPSTVAARVLGRLGVRADTIRALTLRREAGTGKDAVTDVELTRRSKRVIALAFEESERLSNDFVGTEHLLLGLIAEGDGIAARSLAGLGITVERARHCVFELQTHSTRKLADTEALDAAVESLRLRLRALGN